MNRKAKNKRNSSKMIRKVFLIILLLILIFMSVVGLKILQGLNEYNKGTDTYSEIQNIAVRKNNNESEGRIDFEALKKINSEVIGWLTLNETVIDYPVVKGTDNDYYLHHLYTGEYNSLGTLFVDYRNSDLFNDQISVIYGHSMLNGSMFFILEKYKNQSFYEEHRQFVFETENKIYILEPYAGKVMDAKIPFLQFNFNSNDEYFEYIRDFIVTSTFKADFEPSASDRTVMMIKCSADYEDARYVLLCRVKEY